MILPETIGRYSIERLLGKGGISTIACNIRHRSEIEYGFIYGYEYDWSATTDPLAVVKDLVSCLFGLTEQL